MKNFPSNLYPFLNLDRAELYIYIFMVADALLCKDSGPFLLSMVCRKIILFKTSKRCKMIFFKGLYIAQNLSEKYSKKL